MTQMVKKRPYAVTNAFARLATLFLSMLFAVNASADDSACAKAALMSVSGDHVEFLEYRMPLCAENALFIGQLAEAYAQANRLRDAEAVLLRAISAQKSEYLYLELQAQLGRIYIRSGRYSEAETIGQEMIRTRPQAEFGYELLADLYGARGQHEQAATYNALAKDRANGFWNGAMFRYSHPLQTLAVIAGVFLLILAGLSSVRRGWRVRLIEDTPTSKVASAAQGFVELEGWAQPRTAPLLSPLSQTPCVWYHSYIEVTTGKGKNRKTHTRDVKTSRQPFYLADKTGLCLIDLGKLEVRAKRVVETRPNPGRLHHESLIVPGDPLFALGEFSTREGENRLIKPRYGRPFILSSYGQRENTARYRLMLWSGNAMLLAGLVLLPWITVHFLSVFPPDVLLLVVQHYWEMVR